MRSEYQCPRDDACVLRGKVCKKDVVRIEEGRYAPIFGEYDFAKYIACSYSKTLTRLAQDTPLPGVEIVKWGGFNE
jgi:hypothetical protein